VTEAISNIILIGMPGSGKSTVGIMLAKLTARDFLDTDVLIQSLHRRSLQDIVDRDGYRELRRIEEEVLLKLDCRHHVIATGGSAVYSDAAMAHLKKHGTTVFLSVDLATLRQRVHDYDTRGLAKRPDQTLEDLFDERGALYKKYADIIVNCIGLSHEQVCAKIVDELERRTIHE
jgi:shikimate kinase